jgi:ribosomal protein S27E
VQFPPRLRLEPKIEWRYRLWLGFPRGISVIAKSLFDDTEIKIPCPDCGKINKQTVGWLRNHSQVACLGCGFLISPRTSEARRELHKIDKAWAKLVAALNKIGKK